jgi:hypothetical protein
MRAPDSGVRFHQPLPPCPIQEAAQCDRRTRSRSHCGSARTDRRRIRDHGTARMRSACTHPGHRYVSCVPSAHQPRAPSVRRGRPCIDRPRLTGFLFSGRPRTRSKGRGPSHARRNRSSHASISRRSSPLTVGSAEARREKPLAQRAGAGTPPAANQRPRSSPRSRLRSALRVRAARGCAAAGSPTSAPLHRLHIMTSQSRRKVEAQIVMVATSARRRRGRRQGRGAITGAEQCLHRESHGRTRRAPGRPATSTSTRTACRRRGPRSFRVFGQHRPSRNGDRARRASPARTASTSDPKGEGPDLDRVRPRAPRAVSASPLALLSKSRMPKLPSSAPIRLPTVALSTPIRRLAPPVNRTPATAVTRSWVDATLRSRPVASLSSHGDEESAPASVRSMVCDDHPAVRRRSASLLRSPPPARDVRHDQSGLVADDRRPACTSTPMRAARPGLPAALRLDEAPRRRRAAPPRVGSVRRLPAF